MTTSASLQGATAVLNLGGRVKSSSIPVGAPVNPEVADTVAGVLAGIATNNADDPVTIETSVQFSNITTDQTVTVKLYRGPSVAAGVLVATASLDSVADAGPIAATVTLVATDRPGLVSGQSYAIVATSAA